MQQLESVKIINKKLVDHFSLELSSNQPNWRVVWSNDQFEHRLGTYDDYADTEQKIWLRQVTEIRYVPKYRQWIPNKFVLERLLPVPDVNAQDLPDVKLSYEPIYVFEDKDGNPLPPKFEACKFVVECVYGYQYGDKSIQRYADPEATAEKSLEAKRQRIDKIQEQLFGDESNLNTQTFNESGSTIIVPANYNRES